MKSIWADFRYAIRRLAKEPSLAVMVAVVLGLGIGANATVFSMVKGLLKPELPIRDQESVVLLWPVNARRGLDRTTMSPGARCPPETSPIRAPAHARSRASLPIRVTAST